MSNPAEQSAASSAAILLGRGNHHEAIAFSTVFVSFAFIDLECAARCFLYQNAHKECALMSDQV